jgi:hypothetical protein
MCLLFIILFGVYGGSRYCLGIPWEFYSIPITTLIVFVDGQGTIEGFFTTNHHLRCGIAHHLEALRSLLTMVQRSNDWAKKIGSAGRIGSKFETPKPQLYFLYLFVLFYIYRLHVYIYTY